MTSITGTLFGDLEAPESLGELFEIAFSVPAEGNLVRMWRGQADLDWPIHSSAYRRLALSGRSISEPDLVRYEEHLLRHATHQGYRYLDGRALSDFELLARLQHHGAATRLIDATRSLLVALWFCSADHPDKTGALIGIHSHYLGGREQVTEDGNYSDVIDRVASRSHPFTWEPPGVSARIAAQHAQFVFSTVFDDPRGSLRLPDKPTGTLVIPIVPILKTESLNTLMEVFDLRRRTLFPDIDGFSTSNSHKLSTSEMFRW